MTSIPSQPPSTTRLAWLIGATLFAAALACPRSSGAWPNELLGAQQFPPLGSDCLDLSSEPITYGMQYDVPGSGLPDEILDIHDIWLAGGCVGCHNETAMGGLRLDTPESAGYELVLARSSRDEAVFRVVPNRPESSLLYAQLNCEPPSDYSYMPPATKITPVRIPIRLRALVYDWIAQGARGFSSFGFPYSDVVFRDSMESQRQQFNLKPTPGAAYR